MSAPVPTAHHRLFVGVDVVDLTGTRTRNRAADPRLTERVFTPGERARIREAAHPDQELWTLWAAKEAAFKVISKLDDRPPVFRHAAYEVVDPPGTPVSSLAWGDLRVGLGVDADEHRILVWAWNGEAPEILVARASVRDALSILVLDPDAEEWMAQRFREEERDAVHSLPSALVRLLVRRDAARVLGRGESDLTIVCPPGDTGRRPPFLHESGIVSRHADVSISHDGDQLAWAVRRIDPLRG